MATRKIGASADEATAIRILSPVTPASLVLPEAGGDYARLRVAWVLGLEPTEIGEIMTQSEIEDISEWEARKYIRFFISNPEWWPSSRWARASADKCALIHGGSRPPTPI